MTMATNSVQHFTILESFFFFFIARKRLGNYERTEKAFTASSELSYSKDVMHAQPILTSTSQQPEMPILVHDHIFILGNGQSKEAPSSMSSNDIGQQTISPIQAQFYLFFKTHFI